MKKGKILFATAFAAVLSTSFIHAAMIEIGCNNAEYIAYGYARSSDNSSKTLYQTYGECHQSNAMVAIYVTKSNGTIVDGRDAGFGYPNTAMWKVSSSTSHLHKTASAVIY